MAKMHIYTICLIRCQDSQAFPRSEERCDINAESEGTCSSSQLFIVRMAGIACHIIIICRKANMLGTSIWFIGDMDQLGIKSNKSREFYCFSLCCLL